MTKERTERSPWDAARDRTLVYLFVAVGTAIGGTARALVSIAAIKVAGTGFPLGTLTANVVGSFVIGFVATLSGPDGRLFLSARTRHFVMTGICGGFTTFSIFSLETYRVAVAGDYPLAVIILGISVTTWLMAIWSGHAVATRWNRLGGA
jgi:fluoride exporter